MGVIKILMVLCTTAAVGKSFWFGSAATTQTPPLAQDRQFYQYRAFSYPMAPSYPPLVRYLTQSPYQPVQSNRGSQDAAPPSQTPAPSQVTDQMSVQGHSQSNSGMMPQPQHYISSGDPMGIPSIPVNVPLQAALSPMSLQHLQQVQLVPCMCPISVQEAEKLAEVPADQKMGN